jgi:23S rRNA (cytidine1920-2'-O)/16S rRNA (cytidine1409-2'-O)-methyltransferase
LPNTSFFAALNEFAAMKSKPVRKRLDVLLVERGLAESLAKARAMILAGEVRFDGDSKAKAGARVTTDTRIDITSRTQRYASRGGIKLEGALTDFSINPSGRVCLDVGASTGGFTDCLLQKGASRVYAFDVNINQMAWKLQQDNRVIRIQRNVRDLRPTDIPEFADLATADLSFISVGKVLKTIAALLNPRADLLVLVKPQFELPKGSVGPGGIVSDPALHEKAIAGVRAAAATAGLAVLRTCPSCLLGAEGNQEYFLHTRKKALE